MTIKDLARETGYSVGTVSRVLNDQPHVSEQARATILDCARRRGFQLNTTAKTLKQQHGYGILAVVTGHSNELFARMIEAIQLLLADTRYPLTVDYVDEGEDAVLHAVRQCREKKPLGILFLGGDNRFFERSFHLISLPCVILTSDASGLGFSNLSSVTTDDVSAAEQAIEYLISQGHRNIGIISGDRECSGPSRRRFRGCQQALSRHGIRGQSDETARYSFEEGYAAMLRLLEGAPVSAVFAMSDVMAMGALRALHDKGYRVPQDISLMGFDGLTLGNYSFPRLTTVRQQVDLLARTGVEFLLSAIEQGTPARHETVPFEFLVRESVCPPAQGR